MNEDSLFFYEINQDASDNLQIAYFFQFLVLSDSLWVDGQQFNKIKTYHTTTIMRACEYAHYFNLHDPLRCEYQGNKSGQTDRPHIPRWIFFGELPEGAED